MINVEAEREALVRLLRASARPEESEALQKYLGSPYPVLGISVPQMRKVVRMFAGTHRGITSKELNSLVRALWRGPTLDEKATAIMLMNRYPKLLDEESWEIADGWAGESVGWGMCDALGAGPLSTMLYTRPSRFREVMKWIRSGNFWRRRISTYALGDLVYAKEFDKPLELLERLLYDEEFWVQRAVGTWLRECWKRDRQRTERFLLRRARGMPRVVITVATERAPKAFRRELRRMSQR